MSNPLHPTDTESTRVCIFCGHAGIRVYDSRPASNTCKRKLLFPALGVPITRRRKQCEACSKCWTTVEIPEILISTTRAEMAQSLTEYLYTVLRANRSKLKTILGTQKSD